MTQKARSPVLVFVAGTNTSVDFDEQGLQFRHNHCFPNTLAWCRFLFSFLSFFLLLPLSVIFVQGFLACVGDKMSGSEKLLKSRIQLAVERQASVY